MAENEQAKLTNEEIEKLGEDYVNNPSDDAFADYTNAVIKAAQKRLLASLASSAGKELELTKTPEMIGKTQGQRIYARGFNDGVDCQLTRNVIEHTKAKVIVAAQKVEIDRLAKRQITQADAKLIIDWFEGNFRDRVGMDDLYARLAALSSKEGE